VWLILEHRRFYPARDITGRYVTLRVVPPIRELQPPNRRLDSWKEIAAFFGRDERTVKRWEKERSLPVHRLPGSSRARVFAFTEELSQWMHSARSSVQGTDPTAAILGTAQRELSGGPTLVASPARPRRSWIAATAIAAVAVVAVILALPYRHSGLAAITQYRTTGPEQGVSGTRPGNPEARELYLEGRYYWDKRTPEDLNKAVDFFTQAIVRDPSYAPAYVGLADCYNLLREFAAMTPEEAFPRALAAARKAVELDGSSAEAHNSLAFVTFYWNWDAARAEQEFRRAIELNPDYATAHHWYATFLMVLGRFPEALQQIERAQQLEPASTPILADKALILFHQGDAGQATVLLKQVEAAQPAFFSTHRYLAHIYLTNRDYLDYLREAKKAAVLAHDQTELAVVQAAEKGFHSGGERAMLESTLRMQKQFFANGAILAFTVAETYALLGDEAEALRYLRTSYERHEMSFLSVRIHEPFFVLHDDPAFRKLVVQAGLPPLT